MYPPLVNPLVWILEVLYCSCFCYISYHIYKICKSKDRPGFLLPFLCLSSISLACRAVVFMSSHLDTVNAGEIPWLLPLSLQFTQFALVPLFMSEVAADDTAQHWSCVRCHTWPIRYLVFTIACSLMILANTAVIAFSIVAGDSPHVASSTVSLVIRVQQAFSALCYLSLAAGIAYECTIFMRLTPSKYHRVVLPKSPKALSWLGYSLSAIFLLRALYEALASAQVYGLPPFPPLKLIHATFLICFELLPLAACLAIMAPSRVRHTRPTRRSSAAPAGDGSTPDALDEALLPPSISTMLEPPIAPPAQVLRVPGSRSNSRVGRKSASSRSRMPSWTGTSPPSNAPPFYAAMLHRPTGAGMPEHRGRVSSLASPGSINAGGTPPLNSAGRASSGASYLSIDMEPTASSLLLPDAACLHMQDAHPGHSMPHSYAGSFQLPPPAGSYIAQSSPTRWTEGGVW